MPTFYLIRHGLRLSRDEDTFLNAEGIQQAELTGRYFQDKNIQHIFVSPTQRTQHTADIINEYLKIPQTLDPRLKERMEYSSIFGTFETFLDEWDKTMEDRNYQPPHADSAVEAGNRMLTSLEDLGEEANYIFVSHGGVIGDVVRNLFSDSSLSLTTDVKKNLRWLNIPECSITEIKKEGSTYNLNRVADVAHLQ